ncbi:sodium-dependent proline transporter [Ciona intestinalis]
MLTFCGIPLFMIELALGQFSGYGVITAWRASPIFKGIGYGMMVVSFLVAVYYNVIIAWSLFYMFASFQAVLPWTSSCGTDWNVDSCIEPANATCIGLNCTMEPTTAVPEMTTAYTSDVNMTTMAAVKRISSSEEYWRNRVLRINKSDGIDDPGTVLWDLVLCLLLAWLIVFFCLIKGVKSSGKVVYFTATFPYIILIILLVRGCTLEGARKGIVFYVTPKWEKLQTAKVWKDAATQIFYSLGTSFGGLLTFASYNKFSNNIHRDTLIVALGNCATSIFAGFVIFSVIGHMSFKLGLDVEDVVNQGPGLAFIVYPEAVSLLPLPQLWSILFFFMLLTLGLDSQFAMVETVITGFMDEFPKLLRPHKTAFTAGTCIVCFLLGILLVTEGGLYWFELYNWYSAYYGLLLQSLILSLIAAWGYGFFFTYKWRLVKDIKLMIGFKPNWYFRINWMFITPGLLLFVIIYSGIKYVPISVGSYVYPKWADDLGLCMSMTCVALIPIYMTYRIIKAVVQGGSIKQLFLPDEKWGPQDKSYNYDSLTGEGVPNLHLRSSNYIDNPLPTYSQTVNDSVVDPYPS